MSFGMYHPLSSYCFFVFVLKGVRKRVIQQAEPHILLSNQQGSDKRKTLRSGIDENEVNQHAIAPENDKHSCIQKVCYDDSMSAIQTEIPFEKKVMDDNKDDHMDEDATNNIKDNNHNEALEIMKVSSLRTDKGINHAKDRNEKFLSKDAGVEKCSKGTF